MSDGEGSVPGWPGAAEVVPPPTTWPIDQPTKAIALWEPRDIGWVSGILGFPGATLLAALNWRRMGQPRKGVLHLAAAVIGTWALVFVNAGLIGLVVGLIVGFYLYRAQRSDQTRFKAGVLVTERSGLAGAVLAIVATVVVVGTGVLAATALGGGGFAHRGEVLFGSGRTGDVCSLAGQATVFGPSDPIFIVAVMRETVQPGSHVVYEADGPNNKVEPIPVTVQPPFDCLGTSQSIGPLDPGTYVFRYRYEGQPGAADLASGSFTITTSAAAPTSSP
jgi:hypothetical protein